MHLCTQLGIEWCQAICSMLYLLYGRVLCIMKCGIHSKKCMHIIMMHHQGSTERAVCTRGITISKGTKGNTPWSTKRLIGCMEIGSATGPYYPTYESLPRAQLVKKGMERQDLFDVGVYISSFVQSYANKS